MAADRSEVSHCHRKSRQFFSILSGKSADQDKMWTKARCGPGRLSETSPRTLECDVLPTTIQYPNGTLYASGFALSLEEERQPKIWKSRVANGEEQLIATIPGTL